MSVEENLEKKQSIHHLMRVKVRRKVWDELMGIARYETKMTGDPTTVSDIVRAALHDWLKIYNSLQKIKELQEANALQKKLPVSP